MRVEGICRILNEVLSLNAQELDDYGTMVML